MTDTRIKIKRKIRDDRKIEKFLFKIYKIDNKEKKKKKKIPANCNGGNPKNGGEDKDTDEAQRPNRPLVFLRNTLAGNPSWITTPIHDDFHDRCD